MAQGHGEQALVNLLHCPPEQHVAQLEPFEAFVLGQRRNASEVNSQATAESTKTQDEVLLEQCGVAQLIEDDTRMVSYAMYNLRGKASEWVYSALMANADAFPSWAIFKTKIRAMYQPPNNEVLLMALFFGARQAKRSLQEFCAGDAFAVGVHQWGTDTRTYQGGHVHEWT
ncbi:unnamed protein product [Peronospora farinosa]|uniref:Retrotransposon gag domain-containing protein n=1 Tax=Peronospora farinosa TaxID=134698 RepID=A0AAV0TJP8_9STRA|nr:unnamed protein product [Peronospora farinosa]